MTHESIPFEISTWYGCAGGVTNIEAWKLWIHEPSILLPQFERPVLETVPSRLSRRLNILGKVVLACSEKCIPFCGSNVAVITTSRHGDLQSMDKLIDSVRKFDGVSPTAFSYSVHNRFSSLISMFAGYHGTNSAYSSVSDGFPMGMIEATNIIHKDESSEVLLLAYEPEILDSYENLITQRWSPHVAAFVIRKFRGNSTKYHLARHFHSVNKNTDSGSGLPFIRAMLKGESVRDGFWEYVVN